ncbi:MAG TPA: hypothetical protein ENI34_08525 [candidate division WOR-3 bacterium]|uniref:Uncharacterized protein n=1 Tax=candidate division WOR-3 bacterium TaxID=2052148 RepID=A0A9C9K0K4_UNCW3|nr:hypothetical protein [candidate division WOR-3 bacterium]
MRSIIMVTSGEINLKERKEKINNLVKKLSEYLDFYSVSNTSSKYSVMGPVSKIIEMSKNRKNTPEFIKARALRMHEMNRISGYVSNEAIQVMEKAIDELLNFRQELLPTELPRVMEMIDYEVYFCRRKKNIQELEQIREDFINYLKKTYNNKLNDLKSKWGKQHITDWNDIRFPTKTGKYFKEGNEKQKEDIRNFWQQHKDLGKKIIDIEEVNND